MRSRQRIHYGEAFSAVVSLRTSEMDPRARERLAVALDALTDARDRSEVAEVEQLEPDTFEDGDARPVRRPIDYENEDWKRSEELADRVYDDLMES